MSDECYKWEKRPKKIFQNTLLILIILYSTTFGFLFISSDTKIKLTVNLDNPDFININTPIGAKFGNNIFYASSENTTLVPSNLIVMVYGKPFDTLFSSEFYAEQIITSTYNTIDQRIIFHLGEIVTSERMSFTVYSIPLVQGIKNYLQIQTSTAYHCVVFLTVTLKLNATILHDTHLDQLPIDPCIYFMLSPNHVLNNTIQDPTSVVPQIGFSHLTNTYIDINGIMADNIWINSYINYVGTNGNSNLGCYPYLVSGSITQKVEFW